MRLATRHAWKVLALAGLWLGASAVVWAKWEKEQVALESQLQERIENILSKTLSPNSYLVTVKVEMGETGGGARRTSTTRGGANPFLNKSKFVLPGVPEKKQFSTSPSVTEDVTEAATPVEALVKKISITILVAPDVTAEQIRSLREFISSAIPFNPLRGDELDIHTSPLLKTNAPSVKTQDLLAASRSSSGLDRMFDRNTVLMILLLMVVSLGLFGLAAFLYGPVRGFFNRLLAVLPRVGEQAIYAANANNTAAAPAAAPTTPFPTGHNGIAASDNGAPKLNMPFAFVREEQLPKLALIFRDLDAAQAALVLAYLPPAWAGQLLAGLDSGKQSAIMRELSQSREVPAEIVNEVELQIKEKLPYLVGGLEWIQSVFPLTQPQTQRAILGSLSQQSPELARSLRQKTFFFEDLAAMGAAALRVLVQAVGYPQIALAIRDEKKEFRDTVLRKLPAAIRDIVLQELDLSSNEDKKGIQDAKARLVSEARRLLLEGRITLGGTL